MPTIRVLAIRCRNLPVGAELTIIPVCPVGQDLGPAITLNSNNPDGTTSWKILDSVQFPLVALPSADPSFRLYLRNAGNVIQFQSNRPIFANGWGRQRVRFSPSVATAGLIGLDIRMRFEVLEAQAFMGAPIFLLPLRLALLVLTTLQQIAVLFWVGIQSVFRLTLQAIRDPFGRGKDRLDDDDRDDDDRDDDDSPPQEEPKRPEQVPAKLP